MIDCAMAAGSKAHLHPQSLSQSRHVATQHATANQTEFFARQIMDPGAKIAKMRTLLPGSGAQGALVGRQIAGQGQHQGQGMFDHGMHRIALHVADSDTPLTAGFQIHIVGSRGVAVIAILRERPLQDCTQFQRQAFGSRNQHG